MTTNNLALVPEDPNQKGVMKWQPPEKTAMAVMTAGAISVGVYFWGSILPFLIEVLNNTLYFGGLLGVLGILIWFFRRPETRLAFRYYSQMMLRKMVSSVWENRPIEAMKIALASSKKDAKKMESSVEKIAGSAEKVQAKIERLKADAETALERAQAGEALGPDYLMEAELDMQKAQGLQKIISELTPTYEDLVEMKDFLSHMVKAAWHKIKQAEQEVHLLEVKFEASNELNSAMKTAVALFNGGSSDAFMYENAVAHTQDTIARQMGEIKRAMELSEGVLKNFNVEQAMLSARGRKLLDKFKQEGSNFDILKEVEPKKNNSFLNEGAKQVMAQAKDTSKYSKLLEN